MNIEAVVHDFLHKHGNLTSRYIVAVSGGKDSMTLLFICKKLGLDVIAAHCNFQLRGEESRQDDAFVQTYCERHNIKLLRAEFNTAEICQKNGLSIQETARKLRYDWFEEIRLQECADFILTAHHGNDQVETMLFQLSRGSGIKGIRAIPPQNGVILRPMLQVPLEFVMEYAHQHKIPHRDDSSNEKDYYSRNFIRHHVIPSFIQLNKQFVPHMLQTAQFADEYELLLQEKANELYEKHIRLEPDHWLIALNELRKLPYLRSILFHWLSPLGFNTIQLNDLIQNNHISGKHWESSTHRITLNRDELIVMPIQHARYTHKFINDIINQTIEVANQKWDIQILSSPPTSYVAEQIYLDADKLQLPLLIRPWHEGDAFTPMGMKGRKKLSDFFIDAKLSVVEKQKSLVLITSSEEIAAVIPHRPSNHYRITPSTQRVMVIIPNKN